MDQVIKAICGDAVEEMRKLPSGSVKLIVTDPPYNLSKDYGNNDDSLDHESYMEFSRRWLREAVRVLAADGTMYVFMGMKYISYLYGIMERELGLEFNSWITWYYTQGIGKTRGFSARHDDILCFTKHKKNYTFNIDAIRIPQKYYRSINNMRGSNPGNVWQFSHMHYCNRNRLLHPTQKPEALYERMILASSNEGDTVLDPFSGSGTALRVCQQTNRNCIGIELNPEYVRMARRRLALPFHGFDSMDERMKRVPRDLNDDETRIRYLQNHIRWFLRYHADAIPDFIREVKELYLDKMIRADQLWFFESFYAEHEDLLPLQYAT